MNPLTVVFRVGGLYDSRVASASTDISRDDDDSALVFNLSAGRRISVTDNFGFRLGYNGYASFFKELDEYNAVDQAVTVEPQWDSGRFMYSLAAGYGYVLEDGRSNYSRFTLAPAWTVFPGKRQALSFYGLYVNLKDRDGFSPDEDGYGLGGGGAYFFQSANRTRFGLTIGYQETTYDARAADYNPGAGRDKRRDDTFTAGADIRLPLSSHLGLYVDYLYTHNDSSVNTNDYTRHGIQAGLAVWFPASR